MKTFVHRLALSALVCTLFSACSNIRVTQDYAETADFTNLTTYAWQSDSQAKTGDLRVDNSLLDDRVRHAIDQQLPAQQHQKAAREQASFWVAYHYTIRETQPSTDRVRTGVGLGTGTHGTFGGISLMFSDGRSVSEAELVIDVINPADGKLLWRGSASRLWLEDAEPAKLTAQINETVTAILKKFPPEK